MALAVLVSATTTRAADLGMQLGPVAPEGIAVRGHAVWNAHDWLDIQAGVFAAPHGVIPDLTPIFHSPGRHLFIAAGVGIGYNGVHDSRQSKGAIFHDVIGGGYKVSTAVTVTCDLQHWSNGGIYNPVFGTHANRGYTALMFGMTRRL
jgi:hypothetical protein